MRELMCQPPKFNKCAWPIEWMEWLKLIKSVPRLDGWARPEEKGRSVKLSGLLSNPLSRHRFKYIFWKLWFFLLFVQQNTLYSTLRKILDKMWPLQHEETKREDQSGCHSCRIKPCCPQMEETNFLASEVAPTKRRRVQVFF